MRITLIHGIATTGRVWRRVLPLLTAGHEIVIAERPASGTLNTEIAYLSPVCEGAVVVGVSGGATLGLELASRGVNMRGAVLHEPAAGTLAPGLLDHVTTGLRTAGIAGLGTALYGASWTPAETNANLQTITREFAMFGAFEPRSLGSATDRIIVTVGSLSPAARHKSVEALHRAFGVRTTVLAGAGHAAHLQAPHAVVDAVNALLDSLL